jgi:hypothetical protein
MDLYESEDIFSQPLSAKVQSKKDLAKDNFTAHKSKNMNVSPRKWNEFDSANEQTEAVAKIASEMEELNASSISEVWLLLTSK